MGNPKEECFEEAVDALNRKDERAGKEPPEVQHRQPWERNYHSGTWEAVNKTWHHAIGSMRKTYNMLAKDLDIPLWRSGQARFPDVTVTTSTGKKVVVDTKFDRPSGGRDSWGTRQGLGGGTQRGDYNEINRQQTGREGQDLALDADSCNCPKGDGSPSTEPVHDDSVVNDPASPYFNPMIGVVPIPSPGVGIPPVTLPSPMPGPVFVP